MDLARDFNVTHITAESSDPKTRALALEVSAPVSAHLKCLNCNHSRGTHTLLGSCMCVGCDCPGFVLKPPRVPRAKRKDGAEPKAAMCVCGWFDTNHGKDARACPNFWPLKKPGNSPTQRSLAHMHNQRYLCQVVEKWNPHVRIRQDLYGFIDILCVRGDDIVGVQACSGGDVSTRRNKIVEHDNFPLVIAAIRVVVQGWKKNAAGKWVLREEEL
jgi:hypothetical protein